MVGGLNCLFFQHLEDAYEGNMYSFRRSECSGDAEHGERARHRRWRAAGATQGAREGNRAAGPVGGAVGSVVGGTVGGVTGGVKGALGVSDKPKRKKTNQ
jgi:outer membrane lipoprotein SlyB